MKKSEAVNILENILKEVKTYEYAEMSLVDEELIQMAIDALMDVDESTERKEKMMGKGYIITLDKIEGTDLWKARGFNTLVFDQEGIRRLEPARVAIDKAYGEGLESGMRKQRFADGVQIEEKVSEAYEEGKRDALLLMNQKMLGRFDEALTDIMNDIPAGKL